MPAKIRPTVIRITRHRHPLKGKQSAGDKAHPGQRYASARKARNRGLPVSESLLQNLRYTACGGGPLPTTAKEGASTGITKEVLKEAGAFNARGDVRCPHCHQVNRNVATDVHTCDECSKKFAVIQKR